MPGAGHVECGLHRFAIADLADLDDVRRRPDSALQRASVRLGIQPNLALVDDRLLVGMQKFDRVLDRDDV